MRKIILTSIGILIFALNILAQETGKPNPAKDSLLNKICDCVSKSISKPDKNAEEAAQILQECMMTTIMEDPLGSMSAMGLEDFTDQEQAQKMGEKIGMELVSKCPALKNLFIKTTINAGSTPPEKVSSGMVYGKLLGFETNIYQYLLIEEAGKPVRLLLLHDFDNSENFWKEIQSAKGKSISLKWKETSIWNMSSKSFEKQKEITGWSLN